MATSIQVETARFFEALQILIIPERNDESARNLGGRISILATQGRSAHADW